MSNFTKTLLTLALLATTTAQAAPDVPTLLKAADRFRAEAGNLQIETQVTVMGKDGNAEKERRYTVFLQGDRRSLVLMRSPAEAGQKVLMLADDFWLLMPGTQRPLRITPTQKLLGDASTGDIATLSWAEDYTGEVKGTEQCDGKPCLRLSLQGARKGLSYQRIELWLGAVKSEPLKAELYVQSDKLAKRARFIFDKPNAPTQVTEMVLEDHLSNHKATHVRYLSRAPKNVPETWLNPMFLARNPSLE
jgi:Outer membrane lipoprotein-sorting protein